jgi:structural maintenance of chromosome 3 (chondroitin sulfate proteoglycan 6)
LLLQERGLPERRATLGAFDQSLESMDKELASEWSSGLTAEEEAELKRLTLEVDALKVELVKLRTRKSEVEATKSQLESLLHNNLLRKEEELNAKLNAATQEEDKDVMLRDEQELASLNATIKEAEAQLKKQDDEVEKATTRTRALEKELDQLRVRHNTRTRLAVSCVASRSRCSALLLLAFLFLFRPQRVPPLTTYPMMRRRWTS